MACKTRWHANRGWHALKGHGPRRRSAMTLLEVGIALVVVTAAVVAVVELVSVANLHRRAARQRQVALVELANQAERIALLPWNEVTSEKLSTWTPSDILNTEIPTASCQIHVLVESQSPPTRRIDLSITWTNSVGQEVEPARLTLWKIQSEATND